MDTAALMSQLYSVLPSPARSMAASARGAQLRATRYDRDLERLVAEAQEREWWDEDQWLRVLDRQVDRLLDSATRTRHYQDCGPRASGFGRLRQWPFTPKHALRDDPDSFTVPGVQRSGLVVDTTSGTTGTPLRIVLTKAAVRHWYAMYEARIRRWNGVRLSDRWAMFGGQLVVPAERTTPPFWVHNVPMRQLYMSTNHISEQNVVAMAAELRRFAPRFLIGYPSSVALFSTLCLRRGIPLPALEVAISNAEPLTDAQRTVIAEAFRCPVRNTYGMGEMAAGASECEHGALHLWPEAGIVEVLTDDGRISDVPGDRGRLVLTGLLNFAMPLVRYEIGDRGSVPTPSRCPCKRTLPVLEAIEGRSSDFLVTPDGRYVFWVNPIFRGLPIVEAQVVQHAVDAIEIRLVSQAGAWENGHGAELADRLGKRVGESVRIWVTELDSIPRGPSGKFRPVVSQIDATRT